MALKTAKTNKTDAVMRLLTGKKTAANPILDSSFKEERITANTIGAKAIGTEIDITGELVTELMPRVLDRFNCCMCARCYADVMAEALGKVPAMKIRVKDKDDLNRANKMKKQSRKEVLSVLIKIAIERRKLPVHG